MFFWMLQPHRENISHLSYPSTIIKTRWQNSTCRDSLWKCVSVCDVSRNSNKSEVLHGCYIIVWDECTMAYRKEVESVDSCWRTFVIGPRHHSSFLWQCHSNFTSYTRRTQTNSRVWSFDLILLRRKRKCSNIFRFLLKNCKMLNVYVFCLMIYWKSFL